MFNRKHTLPCFLFFIIISNSFGQVYFSPGLRLGWDFGRGATISFKFSLGINFDITKNDDPFQYLNITYGVKQPLFRKTKHSYERYTHLELQGGFWPIRAFLLGGGTGYIFYKEDTITKRRPIVTVDLGCFVFAAIDVIFLENNETSKDFGFLGVFPIPFYGYDFNFN
jgi:hypothetical protein